MTKLKEIGYKLETGNLSSIKEIFIKIQSFLSDDAYFLLESPREYLSGKLSDLSEEKITKLQSLKVFSDKYEFTAEKDNEFYAYRYIIDDESSSDKAYIRETSYLLRKSTVNKAFFQEKLIKIKNKEYFKFNDDGMPLKEFERLCGYERGE